MTTPLQNRCHGDGESAAAYCPLSKIGIRGSSDAVDADRSRLRDSYGRKLAVARMARYWQLRRRAVLGFWQWRTMTAKRISYHAGRPQMFYGFMHCLYPPI